jgi:hypothetical protein
MKAIRGGRLNLFRSIGRCGRLWACVTRRYLKRNPRADITHSARRWSDVIPKATRSTNRSPTCAKQSWFILKACKPTASRCLSKTSLLNRWTLPCLPDLRATRCPNPLPFAPEKWCESPRASDSFSIASVEAMPCTIAHSTNAAWSFQCTARKTSNPGRFAVSSMIWA